MAIHKVIARPSIYTHAGQARNFQLLSGGGVSLLFRGLNDTWSEEVTLSAGDSLKFDRDFTKVEIQSEFEQTIEFYAGFADMRRATTDLTPLGATQLITQSVEAVKGQKLLVSARRNRRSITILPLDCMIYVGSMGVGVNEQIPVMAGQPVTLDISAALYCELDPAHGSETGDIRIMEEVN